MFASRSSRRGRRRRLTQARHAVNIADASSAQQLELRSVCIPHSVSRGVLMFLTDWGYGVCRMIMPTMIKLPNTKHTGRRTLPDEMQSYVSPRQA